LQGLWLSDSFFSVPPIASGQALRGFSDEIKKSYHLNRPKHFNRLGNFQSQRWKARFLEKKFLPLKTNNKIENFFFKTRRA
jgi:hypothetical protein